MSFNWKSNYKLPLSFIVFFVLTFFLLGEQLTALPIYLFGPGVGESGPDKVHILDLALGDGLLHRPFAYLIIGTVIWGLYRIFTWPLPWFAGAVLWILEQQTLTPLDQRPTLINAIVFTFTFWFLLTLAPFFVYRWVDKKWGRVGKRNIILIMLAINLLFFGFFAFQIYILHNSYRGFHKNTGQQGVSSRVLPPNTCPERLITKKDKPTVIYWNGKTLPVDAEEQNWVEENCKESSPTVKNSNNFNVNPYFTGVPCISNPKVQFTHDFTEADKIKSVEPTIITTGNPRHRAWLNISSGKVAVYAPVDSELVNGVYKNSRGALDYDLHFQVSCEIWYLINHVTEPVDKIKNAFPSTPQTDTRTSSPFQEPIRFKAGELLGYTIGTPLARNFDFGVFDLNHFNEGLPADVGSKYGKEANFICPFDILPQEMKAVYYKKIINKEKPFTNCKSNLE